MLFNTASPQTERRLRHCVTHSTGDRIKTGNLTAAADYNSKFSGTITPVVPVLTLGKTSDSTK